MITWNECRRKLQVLPLIGAHWCLLYLISLWGLVWAQNYNIFNVQSNLKYKMYFFVVFSINHKSGLCIRKPNKPLKKFTIALHRNIWNSLIRGPKINSFRFNYFNKVTYNFGALKEFLFLPGRSALMLFSRWKGL